MIDGLVAGRLYGETEQRTDKAGKTFTLAKVRPDTWAIMADYDAFLGRDDVMVRDSITGQRYRAVDGTRDRSVSLVLGGDYSEVFGSALLPDSGIAKLSHQRARLRAGVHWQGAQSEAFYGLTWLGKEFDQQTDDQLVGSINLRLQF